MYTLHCTKKLLARLKAPISTAASAPTTALGNWYATALFWRPQVALLVNERTLLPVLMPLSPATSLTERFPDELAVVLSRHGANQAFIASELASLGAVSVVKTANRHLVGAMNEFAFLAHGYRDHMETSELHVLSMRLADTPCSVIKHQSPERLLKELMAARLTRH
jgi:hypothetical protein